MRQRSDTRIQQLLRASESVHCRPRETVAETDSGSESDLQPGGAGAPRAQTLSADRRGAGRPGVVSEKC